MLRNQHGHPPAPSVPEVHTRPVPRVAAVVHAHPAPHPIPAASVVVIQHGGGGAMLPAQGYYRNPHAPALLFTQVPVVHTPAPTPAHGHSSVHGHHPTSAHGHSSVHGHHPPSAHGHSSVHDYHPTSSINPFAR